MKQNQHQWTPLIWGGVVSVIMAFVLLSLCALLMTVKDMSESVTSVLSMVVLAVASFAGGFVGTRMAGKGGMKNGCIIGGILVLILVLLNIIINGLHFDSAWLLKAAVGCGCGMVGGIVGVNSTGKHKMKL